MEFGKLNFAVAFNPQTAFPLDARYYFETLAAAQAAAAAAVEVGSSSGTYFFGETIVVNDGTSATLYVIQPDGTLKAIAAGGSVEELRQEVAALSAALSTDYVEKIGTALETANTYTDEVSAALSTDYTSKIETAINNLDAEFIAPSKKLVNKISQVDGLVSVDYRDLTMTEVSGLTDRLAAMDADIGSRALDSEFKAVSADYLVTKAQVATNVTNIAANATAIEAEETRATTAEAALQTAVETEEARAKANEGGLSAALTAEETRAKANESGLSAALTAEETARSEADAELSATIAATYLSVSTFTDWKNETGLSAAGAGEDNQVVLYKDVKDLIGTAMHFRGVAKDNEISGTGSTKNPITLDDDTQLTAENGDVVLQATTEFIWANGSWHEIGDEGMYLTKAEFNTWKNGAYKTFCDGVELSAKNLSDAIAADKLELQGNIDDLRSDVSAYALSADVTSIKNALEAKDDVLSGKIDNKIWIKDPTTAGFEDGKNSDLSIIKMTADEYEDLLASGTPLSGNTLYVLSSAYENAFGQNIKNVGDPEDDADAANKKYVDNTVSSTAHALSTDYNTKIDAIESNSITSIVFNGQVFTVENNVASIAISAINCGSANS